MPQPMQMGMIAAPIVMPMLESSSGSAYYGAPFPGFADGSYSWAAEAPFWPVHIDQSYYAEDFPPQYANVDFMWQAGFGRAEIPEQITMDLTRVQPDSTVEAQRGTAAPANAGKLRHRKGQDCSMHASHGMESDLSNVDRQQTNLDRDTDTMNAQARELATNLLVQMQIGGNAQRAAVASFERLAFTSKISSLAAQMALEEASMNDKVALASSLRSHVCNAVQSKHANHVIQKVVEVMTVAQASFIVDELKGSANEFARHVFG